MLNPDRTTGLSVQPRGRSAATVIFPICILKPCWSKWGENDRESGRDVGPWGCDDKLLAGRDSEWPDVMLGDGWAEKPRALR